MQVLHRLEVRVNRGAEGKTGKVFVGNLSEENALELAGKVISESFVWLVSASVLHVTASHSRLACSLMLFLCCFLKGISALTMLLERLIQIGTSLHPAKSTCVTGTVQQCPITDQQQCGHAGNAIVLTASSYLRRLLQLSYSGSMSDREAKT